jgi:flagellar hook-basal body complex protein FliE
MKIDSSAISSFIKTNSMDSINKYLNNAGSEEKVNESNFGDMLKEAIETANSTDSVDKSSNIDLLKGEVNDLHTLMINAEKADIALSLTIQIRNKVLEAYNEVMRMQI